MSTEQQSSTKDNSKTPLSPNILNLPKHNHHRRHKSRDKSGDSNLSSDYTTLFKQNVNINNLDDGGSKNLKYAKKKTLRMMPSSPLSRRHSQNDLIANTRSKSNTKLRMNLNKLKINVLNEPEKSLDKLTTSIEKEELMNLPNIGIQKITYIDLSYQNCPELGSGAFGTVHSILIYKKTEKGVIIKPEITCKIAVKKIPMQSKQTLEREMCIKHMNSEYILNYFGTIQYDGCIHLCMEQCHTCTEKFYYAASAQKSYKNTEIFLTSQEFNKSFPNYIKYNLKNEQIPHMPEPFIGKFLFCVISGLQYMKNIHSKMHRDIKPSNILIKIGSGKNPTVFKLCDFGISGNLTNSVAKTRAIGCEAYFAPERFKILEYKDNCKESNNNSPANTGFKVQSDVWSLGVTTLELCMCKYPFNDGKKSGAIFKLISDFGMIEDLKRSSREVKIENLDKTEIDKVKKPSKSLATLNPYLYSQNLCLFIKNALKKQPEERPDYEELSGYDFFKYYDIKNDDKRSVDEEFNLNLFCELVWDKIVNHSVLEEKL